MPLRRTAYGLTAAVLLAGCSTAAPADEPAGTRTYPVPGDARLTVSAPADWNSSSLDGVYYLSGPDAHAGVRPTVVIVPGPLDGDSLQQAAVETSVYGSEHLTHWTVREEAADTVAGRDAYRVSGTHTTRGTEVAEDVLVVGIDGTDAAWVTVTTAVGDDAGAAAARDVAETLTVSENGAADDA